MMYSKEYDVLEINEPPKSNKSFWSLVSIKVRYKATQNESRIDMRRDQYKRWCIERELIEKYNIPVDLLDQYRDIVSSIASWEESYFNSPDQ